MSFMSEVIWEGYANTSSSETLKEQFSEFCDWCWGHSYGDCDICRKEYHKLYIPLRIAEKQKELGLPVTRRKEGGKWKELKPCPFCGGKAEILINEYSDSRKEYLVACTECDGMVERWRETEEEAVEQWNRRVSDKEGTKC